MDKDSFLRKKSESFVVPDRDVEQKKAEASEFSDSDWSDEEIGLNETDMFLDNLINKGLGKETDESRFSRLFDEGKNFSWFLLNNHSACNFFAKEDLDLYTNSKIFDQRLIDDARSLVYKRKFGMKVTEFSTSMLAYLNTSKLRNPELIKVLTVGQSPFEIAYHTACNLTLKQAQEFYTFSRNYWHLHILEYMNKIRQKGCAACSEVDLGLPSNLIQLIKCSPAYSQYSQDHQTLATNILDYVRIFAHNSQTLEIFLPQEDSFGVIKNIVDLQSTYQPYYGLEQNSEIIK